MKKVITKADYIRNATDEQLAEMIINCDDELITPSCNKKYCEYHRENGLCDKVSEEECGNALLKWLQSPVEEGQPWYE